MDIPNPRRILILSPLDTPIASVLNGNPPLPLPQSPTPALNSHPPLALTTTTATPHSPDLHHQITTPYYTALIPIWTDTLLLPGWTSSWHHPSARPVIRAIGAFVLVVRKPGSSSDLEDVKGLLRAVNEVLDGGWDGVKVIVGVRRGLVGGEDMGEQEEEEEGDGDREEEEEEAWERMAMEEGWEWVDGEVDVGAGARRGQYGGEYGGGYKFSSVVLQSFGF